MQLIQFSANLLIVMPALACSNSEDAQAQTGGSGTAGMKGVASSLVTGGAPSSRSSTIEGDAGGGGGARSSGGSATTSTLAATGGGMNTGGAAPTGGHSATGGAATGGAPAPCPGNGGASMVRVSAEYCIDSMEVTRDQYAAWLATNPALPVSSDVNCGWKSTTSYAPDSYCMSTASFLCTGACGNHPQVCVDWCDAYGYCASVGKRLCGKIGGGSNDFGFFGDPTSSQWYNACIGSFSDYKYPYGNKYTTTACNGYDLGKKTTVPVGCRSTCQTSASDPGIYDMSGNVSEWEDSCDGTGKLSNCRYRGGSLEDIDIDLTCAANSYVSAYDVRNTAASTVGFRCCAP